MKYLFVLCFMISSLAFAQTTGEYKPAPKVTPAEEKATEKFEQALKRVRVGMSRNDLHQALPHCRQTAYKKDGKQEWVTLSSWITEGEDESATFYLKDGRVSGWEVNKK